MRALLLVSTMPKVPSQFTGFCYGPLTEDVEELLARFQQKDSVRFQEFSSLWRDMRFSEVFLGLSDADLKKFSRICMSTALRFFLPPYSYQVRVGGLYLMFGFFHTQVTCPPVRIRLALKDWVHVQEFLRVSVNGDHHDVVYVYQKLLADKAFHFTAMPQFLTFQKKRGPQTEEVQKQRGPQTEEVHLSRDTGVQDLVSSDFLEELSSVQNLYETMKVKVGCGVSTAHRDFSSRLVDCMSEETAVPSETTEDTKAGDEKDEESSSRARLLSSIKQRSYGHFQEASKSRRHRKLEVVDVSSDVHQVQEAGPSQKKRPVSLRARTQKSLAVTEQRSHVRRWLLSVPEGTQGVPLTGTNRPEGQSRT